MKEIIFNKILPNVAKPVRYAGGEYNIAEMKEGAFNFAFAFPDTYEVGMSHLGMKILYGLLNNMDNVNCERVFAPMPDMAEQLKKHDLPLFTLETYKPLNEFDFVGFSLQYEMCITNVLYMLKLGKIPLLSKDRDDNSPIVMAGGPCCVNPEPFCEFFDLIVIGEAEEVLPELMALYEKTKDRETYLIKAAQIEGVYVPSFYEVCYDSGGKILSRTAFNGAKEKIKRRLIKDMNSVYYPESVIVPYTEPVHDRIMQEVMRGCPRGCRFCQAGFIYRPARQKSVDTVKNQLDALIKSTGYEQVSLASLSTTDYKGCEAVIHYVMNEYENDKISISLPSLRIDKFSVNMVKEIQKVRLGALTFAPEAGSQTMRDVINKNINEEEILSTLEEAFKIGFTKIKLYFMVGLPYESEEDILGISQLVDKIMVMYFGLKLKSKFPTISVSIGCFVPKPFTPFQFGGQNSKQEFDEKQKIIQRTLNRKVKLSYPHSDLAVMEGAFARGDRRLNKVILNAFENGCYFDSWPDHFNISAWEKAFADEELDYHALAQREFAHDETLPWDFIDIGIEKEFFIREEEKSRLAATTPNCFESCSNCGINKEYGRCSFEI